MKKILGFLFIVCSLGLSATVHGETTNSQQLLSNNINTELINHNSNAILSSTEGSTTDSINLGAQSPAVKSTTRTELDVTGAAKTLLQTSAVQKEMKVSLQETQVSSEFSKRDSVTNKEAVPVSKDELLEQSEVVVSTSSIQKNKILDNKKNRANFVTSSPLIKEKPSNSKDASGVIDNSASPLSYRKAKEVVSLRQPLKNQKVEAQPLLISNSSEKKASVYTNSHDFWDYQWDMKYVTNNGESYALYQPSKKISVGIIDSGIMEEHPDLSNSLGNYFKNLVPKGGFDNEEPDETGNPSDIVDKMGHGTEVAGQITANGNILGVAPGITVNIYRVFSENLSKSEWVARAIRRAADDGNKVINISAGQYLMISGSYDDGTNDYQEYLNYKSAINYATAKGSIVVAALGNDSLNIQDNQTMINFLKRFRSIKVPGKVVDAPSVFEDVIAVGGIDGYGNISDFSNIGADAIYAPAGTTANFKKYGQDKFVSQGYYLKDWLFTTTNTGWYQYVYGNSFATPKVSGALALVVDKYGIKNPNQLKRFLLMNSPEVNGNRVLNIVDLLNGKNKAFSLDTDKGQDDAINHKSMENLKESRDTMKQEQDKEIQRNTNNNFSIKNDFHNISKEVISVDYNINQKMANNRNSRGAVSVRSQEILPVTGDGEDFLPALGIVCISILGILKRKTKN
ncbi:S8 family peptidase [Lactococcus lactis]|uniref:Leader peptide-processing serine protease n=1 Tax=Lactococcus lactis TaxID=1358 RepID=A0A3S4MAJ8_9LACT|nr:S8 family serine peptidase [Lactococcus lactis]NYZ59724.1 S8 family serine peptidase [Lactococcus lactis]RWR44601.1 peptidase [Lactococcus lactis]